MAHSPSVLAHTHGPFQEFFNRKGELIAVRCEKCKKIVWRRTVRGLTLFGVVGMREAKVALELSKREARNLLSAISSELQEGPYSLHPMDEGEYKAYVASLRSVMDKLVLARRRARRRK